MTAGRWHASYVETHPVRGTRTSSPVCFETRTKATHYTAAVDRLTGPEVRQRRRWRVAPCDCPGRPTQ